ncbi:hypothetical protein HKCCE2091_12110 [Rhodobacterales bacterium HKCCE2091]|nr:hypothetical protein [Rhodobacterales bacterium HKCCE2091]
MPNAVYGFGFALLTAFLVIAADYLLKLAALRGALLSWEVAGGCALYAASALLWFGAVRHASLAQAGVAYAMITLVALAVMGVVAFGENLRLREVAGVGLALVAMGLMVRV